MNSDALPHTGAASRVAAHASISRRRRRPVLAAVAAVVVAAGAGVCGLAIVATGSGWKAEYAKVADTVAPGYRLTDRTASGNAMCLDVCRQLASQFVTEEPAEVAIAKAVERMRLAGFTAVGSDCRENVWCSAWGNAGDLGVYVSKYKGDSWAAEEPGLADQLSVTVAMPE